MNQGPDENNILYSLPTNTADKIDFFGEMIVNIGNLITVIGIAVEAQEVEEVEEVEEGVGEGATKNPNTTNSGSDSNAGFILSLIGAILVTIGDMVSTGSTALAIEQTALLEKKAEQEAKEQSRKIKKMEKQIDSLHQDMKSLFFITESLKREVIFLQNFIYPHFHQQ
ncbi:hypothetical protein [Peribacillus simplex]|uniref:hypothetical protein n=1 Tax=Peribacillus simplex TaxID=1478 RepID=UPI0011A7C1B8|nr:hypothetical protein [Peribacillus simplex]